MDVSKLKVLRSFILPLLVGVLACGMLSTTSFYLFKKTAFFDDAFIYLHMAANIAEAGTARYFPIAESGLLLASSPLRLLTLVPGFLILHFFDVPLRTLEAARFAFLTSGFVAFLVFSPFWTNRIKSYLAASAAFFLLGAALDSLFLMEGGVLFFSLLTLMKLLVERSNNHFSVGVVTLLVGLSRPEVGFVAAVAVFIIYLHDRKLLVKFILGLTVALAIYWMVMSMLGVYPVPSTIWSKQITGKLKLFSQDSLITVLPTSIAYLLGLPGKWFGWLFVAMPVLFSLPLKKKAIPVIFFVGALLAIAVSMPGNFVWYSENFVIVVFVLAIGVAAELYRARYTGVSYVLGSAIGVCFALLLASGFGMNRPYPWNEGTPGYRAYHEIGMSAGNNGEYLLERYSSGPVRIRMCEIGIVSYFSGVNSWIYDLCGLAQIGNLQGAARSWLRHFYPSRFTETGDDQLSRFSTGIPVIDVWALRSEEEAKDAVEKCKYVDERFCINPYR